MLDKRVLPIFHKFLYYVFWDGLFERNKIIDILMNNTSVFKQLQKCVLLLFTESRVQQRAVTELGDECHRYKSERNCWWTVPCFAPVVVVGNWRWDKFGWVWHLLVQSGLGVGSIRWGWLSVEFQLFLLQQEAEKNRFLHL